MLKKPVRVEYLDTAKAIGMYLVFLGHFLEKLYYAGSTAVFPGLKLIYSFHVPLFFFLAGIFWKPGGQPLHHILFSKFKARILPTLFFGAIAIPFWLVLEKAPVADVLIKAADYTRGWPSLNWVTWFLVCLFATESIIACSHRLVPMPATSKPYARAAVLFLLGWLLAAKAQAITKATGVPLNFWFVNESFTAGGFYLLGHCAKEFLLKPRHRLHDALGCVVSGILLGWTYNLNTGPFEAPRAVVLMTFSSHGAYWLFVPTALFGIAFVIYTARLLPAGSIPFAFVGENTLPYLGLNGLCLSFLDTRFLNKFDYFPVALPGIALFPIAYCVIIMIAFAPVVWVIRKYAPAWVIPRSRDATTSSNGMQTGNRQPNP